MFLCLLICVSVEGPVFQWASTMWQLHLRRVGVEARPDLIQGISRGGSGGSPSEENDEREDPDDPPKDDKEATEGPSTDTQLHPAPESSESHSLDDQPLSNARVCHFVHEDMLLLFLPQLWEILFLYLFPLKLGALYITLNYFWKFRQVV